MNVASLIPPENGDLHEFEIDFVHSHNGLAVLAHHIVRSKNVKNALASFNKAVPNHGAIKAIRKVVAA